MNGHNGHSAHYADTEGFSNTARDYDRSRGSSASRRRASIPGTSATGGNAAAKPAFSVDAGSLLRPASRRWPWLFIGALLGAAAGAALGLQLWKTGYSATAQIVRYDPPVASDAYRPQPLGGHTLIGMLESPEIRRRAAEHLNLTVAQLGPVKIVPQRQSEIVTILAAGSEPRAAVELANAFNRAVIAFTQDYQRQEATEADVYVAQHLADTEADLANALKTVKSGALSSALLTSPNGSPIIVSGRRLEQIQAEEDELAMLLSRYTDIHPLVKQQRLKIAAMKAQISAGLNGELGATTPEGLSGNPSLGGAASPSTVTREEGEVALFKVRQYENLRAHLVARQRAIQLFKANPPGTFRVMQVASMDTIAVHEPWLKVGLVAVFFGMLGLLVTGGEVLRREFFDTRLKTEADVTRVTGLPVLATLGDIRQMSPAERESWSFRSWIALQDRLAYSPNHGLICGVTSSELGDGRSTWISLLAGAARRCGFRVLTIATRPTAEAATTANAADSEATARAFAAAHVSAAHSSAISSDASTRVLTQPANGAQTTAVFTDPEDLGSASRNFNADTEFTALTASALFTPAMVTEKLMGTDTDPLVHIPLPGWTWNLERRKQWQGALNVWRKIDNVVILVELPPASMPESVLLAANLPNLLWLVESGKSDAVATRAQLETLRHARCNLVGSVINRALTPMAEGRFSRWVGCLALLGILGLTAGHSLVAGEAPRTTPSGQVTTTDANTAFSVVSPRQRAQWQQKLTLGPGDVLNFSLYGEPELSREEVLIGPDGRVSYLEAQGIMAAGLTVDEFREKLNEALAEYRRAPQAFVSPVSYRSKKYFVLGRVTQRGAFPLDRPMTLVEAVARAGGMETGLAADRSMIELADLSRSFLARNGQRVPVDFEKLFQHGDLSQNVALEPNDYIYFPAGTEKEVYVLGAVRAPGAYVYNHSTGVVGAIAGRGGFSDRAWKRKLLVIRGGLTRPETFQVDVNEVLAGRTPDLKLNPKDIVFVHDRPWLYAEELLNAAANAFVTSAIVVWTSEKVTHDFQ
jgi:protein involved in polysaccharide export with SLBB domain/capsular polysaccharide biosynthesis protein